MFHRNTFHGPEINGNPNVYIGDLKFEIRARAVRHIITNTREPPFEQRLNLHQEGDPIERHTDLIKPGYIRWVKITLYAEKDSVWHKFSF